MAKNWLKYLKDKQIFDFVNSHFLPKICEQDFDEFLDNNIIKYTDSQGSHIEVYFECEEYKKFYASIEFTNYRCKLHDKNDYPMFINEDKKFYKTSETSTTERSTLVDYRKMMVNACGPEYAKKLSKVMIKEILALNRHPLAGTKTKSTMYKNMCSDYEQIFGKQPDIPANTRASSIVVE